MSKKTKKTKAKNTKTKRRRSNSTGREPYRIVWCNPPARWVILPDEDDDEAGTWWISAWGLDHETEAVAVKSGKMGKEHVIAVEPHPYIKGLFRKLVDFGPFR